MAEPTDIELDSATALQRDYATSDALQRDYAPSDAETENLQGALDTALGGADTALVESGENVPEYVAPSEDKLDTVTDASAYGTPETKVAWQLNQLLQSDSDYMKESDRGATELANRYGALGSSMHASAARRESIRSALPIATSDAEGARGFGMQQQAAENEVNVSQAETELGSALQQQRVALENSQTALSSKLDMLAQGLDQEGRAMLEGVNARFADQTKTLEADLQQMLNSNQIDADTATFARAQAGELIENYQISVEELLQDPDFLALGSSAVEQTLNNMLQTTTAGIQFVADSSGINLDDYLDDFFENAQFTADITPEEED